MPSTALAVQPPAQQPTAPAAGTTLPNGGEGRQIGNRYGLGPREAAAIAKRVVEEHRKLKGNLFQRMLTAQKYAYHLHGEGDAQWADIQGGRQVKIPRRREGALRHQDNIERPMVDYWIAYFTSQPFRAIAEHRADQKSRDRARIDSIIANHHIHEQQLNPQTAAAMWQAAFNGWGMLHSMWRNDVTQDAQENEGGYSQQTVFPGFTDVFAGNPFDTVFAPSATRFTMPWFQYGRSMPTRLVRAAFPDVKGIEQLHGSDTEPSTAWFQRMLRKWEWLYQGGNESHGSAALTGSGVEDNLGLICKEIAPGQVSGFPEGLLIVVGLKGASDTGGTEGPQGEPILLHFGPLPGGVLSGTRFFALMAGDDPNGKAYLADLDDDQVRLNQAITMYAEMMSQYAYPQLFVPQGTQLLQNQTWGDKIIEYISMPGTPPPQYQFPGSGTNFVAILNYIKDIRESAFRKGGWQASSRGESSGANEPAKRAQFLAAQDKMIFAPTALAFRSSLIDVLRKNHALRRQYQGLPLLVDALGDELAYMADEYIHKQDMSASPPNFSLVQGFGASDEERLAQLNELVVLRGGDGQPILPVKRYWQLHPDPALRPLEPDPDDARKRRAHAINLQIVRVCEDYLQQNQQTPAQWYAQVAVQLAAQVAQRFPATWTDGYNLQLFVNALDTLVQDPTTQPLIAATAAERQKGLLMWMQQAAAAAAPPATGTDGKPVAGGGAPAAAGAPNQ